jgi:hypothetical protein
VKGVGVVVIVVSSCCRKRRVLMLRALGMRLLTRLLLLVCSLSLVSLFFLSRCGLNVDPEVQLEPGTGKYAHSFYEACPESKDTKVLNMYNIFN